MIKGEEMGRRAKDKHSILIGGIALVQMHSNRRGT